MPGGTRGRTYRSRTCRNSIRVAQRAAGRHVDVAAVPGVSVVMGLTTVAVRAPGGRDGGSIPEEAERHDDRGDPDVADGEQRIFRPNGTHVRYVPSRGAIEPTCRMAR